MKRKKLFYKIGIILVLLLIITFPYIKAEYLTIRYGHEFIGLESQTNMLNSSRYHKVFNYSDTTATVFYVSDSGDLIAFVKNEGVWKLKKWETIWSKSGSADGFIWPYYR